MNKITCNDDYNGVVQWRSAESQKKGNTKHHARNCICNLRHRFNYKISVRMNFTAGSYKSGSINKSSSKNSRKQTYPQRICKYMNKCLISKN